MGRFHIMEYINYIMWAPKQSWNTCLSFMHSCSHIGWSYNPDINHMLGCITLHPNTVHKKHCQSRYYSLNTIFIVAFSPKLPILLTIFVLFIHALSIICTGINSFLFSNFLLMKVRWWMPMSDAKHKMEHNHVVE